MNQLQRSDVQNIIPWDVSSFYRTPPPFSQRPVDLLIFYQEIIKIKINVCFCYGIILHYAQGSAVNTFYAWIGTDN